ncbi:bifunctional diguanylate cyclase/phosphodiesterase [Aliiroseovarius subalbicans]|uniref:putative bifunctional diguanylate cyclase/phosphodiesterase n=1 Tax=Aliiroseovarius subalbicans TaxID=2925840 RepID=UPI001F5980D0|nr:bifunctional diguanylate cyclase/phosphodiesterase [Aliiroseovarius subalbicans]MCI2401111.1 bifunctional diguanylate cyclase/phosphodiesterase [Aliiroseovarius subalbicans]
MAATSAMMTRNRIKQTLRAALVGPQLAAFIPALTLGAYWFGGEGFLLFSALLFPALLALTSILTRPDPPVLGRKDPITGLPRGDHALATLDDAAADGTCTCLVIELEDLSGLRAQYGVPAAEHILQRCAERLQTTLRDGDVVTSLAPGRFAAVIEKNKRVDLETMIQFAGRLQSALSDPIAVDGARVLMTSSIGFALPSRVDDQTGEAMLAAAESALDEAKRAGPGSIRAYTAGMRPRITTADQGVKDIVRALEDGQIVPWFQPQISTDTGQLSGFEALARWEDPERGHIAPSSFLPAIAEAGLFERLGEVILFKSLSALREWDRAGLHVPNVSVNFSAEELRNPKLVDRVRWELDRFEMSADRLTIEILENVVAQSDDDITTRNIAALAKLGCSIDLDDFGTGNASIGNIRRFDVNRIKIDRSFVTHVDTDRDQQNMVAAILTMAERLNLETLAEGVESHGEHSMLAQLGCGHVQGFSIARPMPLEQTGAWIAEHERKLTKTPTLPRRTG